MSKSATATVPKIPAQLPARSAWSRGSPQTASSSRSQSPAPQNTTVHATHSRRPSTLGQGIHIKDGVSIPRNNVGAAKQVSFGSIDDVSAPMSSSPAATKPGSSSTTPHKPRKKDIAKLFQNPSSAPLPQASSYTSSPNIRPSNLPPSSQPPSIPSSSSSHPPYSPFVPQNGMRPQQPNAGPNASASGSGPRSPPYQRQIPNGNAPRMTPHPPPANMPPLMQTQMVWQPNYYYMGEQPYMYPWYAMPQQPQHDSPPSGGHDLPHDEITVSPHNHPLPLQGPKTPTPTHAIPATHPPHLPPTMSHSSSGSISGLLSPPPTLSSASMPGTGPLNTNANTFLPGQRSSARISLKNVYGTEINLENLKNQKHSPTLSGAGIRNRRSVVRMESEEERSKRLAGEREKEQAKAKAEADSKAKKRKEEKEQEEKEKKHLRLEEEERKKAEEAERKRLQQEQEEREKERLCLEEEEKERACIAEEEAAKAKAEAEPAAATTKPEEGELIKETPSAEATVTSKEKEKDLRINTTSPPSELPRHHPGPLDLSTTKANIPAPLPSALTTARIIDDLGRVPYPEGIKSPRVELNINAKDGKFIYDRDFLLQFMSICKEKPESLPALDAIGLEPSDQSSYPMSRGRSRRHRQSSGSVPSQCQNAITLLQQSAHDLGSPDLVEVKSLLKKLTTEKFDSISDQIISWVNKSEKEKDGQTLIQVARLVYEKAVDDATYTQIYARLCQKMMKRISAKVQIDGVKNAKGEPFAGSELFREYLLSRCQEDFERGWVAKEVTVAAAASKATAEKKGNDKEEIALYSEDSRAVQKVKRQHPCLIEFIGELFKLQVLTERIIHKHVKKLLGNVENPEDRKIEALCMLLTTVGQLLDTKHACARMDVYFSHMKELMKNPNVSPYMHSMLQGVLELRERKWDSRNAIAAPTTITWIHEVLG